MTSPGGGFQIAEAYVEVDLRENIEQDTRRITRVMERVLPDKKVIPVGLQLDDAGPEMRALRKQLRDLNKAAKITPTYEPEHFIDAMGRARVRYRKVSRDTGSFIGEVMSKNFTKSMAKAIRFPAVFGPLIAGAAAFASSSALLAIPAVFGKIAVDSVRELDDVAIALKRLEKDVQDAFRHDSSMLADPLVDAARRIGDGFEALRPQMRQVFSTLPPLLDHAADSLNAIAANAMPAVVRAARSAGPAVMGAFEGLYNLSDGVVEFLDHLRVAAPEAGQTFRTIGTILGDVAAMAGQVGAAVTVAFGGSLWDEAEAVFGKLASSIGNLVANALPGLTAGLEVAGQFMNALLTVLEPVSGLMGSWLGTVLGVTIAVRGFSSALGVVAAAVNVLKFTPLIAAFTTLATQVGNAGVALGGFAQRVTGSATAAERVASVTSGMVTGFGKVASSLPIVGTAVLGLALAYDGLTISSDEATQAIRQGGDAAAQAVLDLRSQTEVVKTLNQEWVGLSSAGKGVLDMLTTDTDEYKASLDRVGLAQFAAAEALAHYKAEVEAHGPTSQEAKDAAEALAVARLEEERTTHAAERATRGYTQSLIDHQMQIMAQADANLAHRMAIHAQKEAREALTLALRENGAGSDEATEAQFRLEQADLRLIEASGRLAEEQNALGTETEKAQSAAEAQRAAILRLATSAEGRGSPTVRNLAAAMTQAELDAHNAAVETSGFAYEVETLPDGRTVLIRADADRQPIRDFQSAIDRLRGKTIYVSVKYRYPVNINRALAGYGMASGGLLKPMAEGGVLGFAGGGGATLTPMSGRFATVVKPNTWRVIGDNMRHPELFAPLDGSKRSLELLRAGAEAFGQAMVPMPAPAPAPSVSSAPASGRAERSSARRERYGGDVHVHVEQTSGSPAETGRFVALALRGVG